MEYEYKILETFYNKGWKLSLSRSTNIKYSNAIDWLYANELIMCVGGEWIKISKKGKRCLKFKKILDDLN